MTEEKTALEIARSTNRAPAKLPVRGDEQAALVVPGLEFGAPEAELPAMKTEAMPPTMPVEVVLPAGASAASRTAGEVPVRVCPDVLPIVLIR